MAKPIAANKHYLPNKQATKVTKEETTTTTTSTHAGSVTAGTGCQKVGWGRVAKGGMQRLSEIVGSVPKRYGPVRLGRAGRRPGSSLRVARFG